MSRGLLFILRLETFQDHVLKALGVLLLIWGPACEAMVYEHAMFSVVWGQKRGFCTCIYIVTEEEHGCWGGTELAPSSPPVFGTTERVQNLWPSQVPASWELPSSRQLGLDHRRELGASGVLYLQSSNLSGCRLQARWRDKGCLFTALCPHQPKPRCWSHEGPRAHVCPVLCVCFCVCSKSVLCSASGTLQSSACATMHLGQGANVWAHVSVLGRITSKCILIPRVCAAAFPEAFRVCGNISVTQ